MSEKANKLKNPLRKKLITLSLIERSASSLYKDPSMGTLAAGAAKSFVVPLDEIGNLVNPLTQDEQTYFEDVLGLDLNPYAKNSASNPKANFWTNNKATRVVLRKKSKNNASADRVLDLSKPYDYIAWKIALISPRVANSWAERNETLEYEFVLKDGEVQLNEELEFTKMEGDVNEYLFKHKASKKKLFDLLRLYGVENISKQISYDNSTEWLYNELRKIARRPKDIKSLYGLVDLGEKDVYMKVLIADAITIGLIDKRPHEYRLMGGESIGSNESEVIAYLENLQHSNLKQSFEVKIDEFYKSKK